MVLKLCLCVSVGAAECCFNFCGNSISHRFLIVVRFPFPFFYLHIHFKWLFIFLCSVAANAIIRTIFDVPMWCHGETVLLVVVHRLHSPVLCASILFVHINSTFQIIFQDDKNFYIISGKIKLHNPNKWRLYSWAKFIIACPHSFKYLFISIVSQCFCCSRLPMVGFSNGCMHTVQVCQENRSTMSTCSKENCMQNAARKVFK